MNKRNPGSIEANKQVVRNFFERAWNLGDDAAIDEYIAEDAGGNDPDFGAGREGFRRHWKEWRAAFPDLHFQIIDLIAERDYVLCRWVLTGTHQGTYLGVAPTGKKIEVGGMSLERIGNGQIIDGFDGWDNLGFRQQIGALQTTS